MRRSRALCFGFVTFALVALAGHLAAQAQDTSQDTAPLAFDVASVKQVREPGQSRGIRVASGRFTSTDMPLMSLIARAYGVPHWKIRNAPDWVRAERFTVQATYPASSSPGQVNAMLRTLLEQRFRLSVQQETREMDTDLLILDNRDRRLGPGLHPVSVDCQTNALRDGSAPGLFASMDKRPPCNSAIVSVRFKPDDLTSMQRSSAVKYVGITMTELADSLSGSRERPVLNRTELAGQFDVELDYASEEAPSAAPDRAGAVAPGNAPTLSVALEEQLGLGLRRERNPVDVMVVRAVERPRPDEN